MGNVSGSSVSISVCLLSAYLSAATVETPSGTEARGELGWRFGFSPRPNSATRGATGDRVPLVNSREWALGSSGVKATAACRQRKEKEPSIGTACPLAVPLDPAPERPAGASDTCPMPFLALPAAAANIEM